MMIRTASAFALFFAAFSCLHAEDDYKTLMTGVTDLKVALPKIEQYVKDHPKAKDVYEAKFMLAQIYSSKGQPDLAVAEVEAIYDVIAKGAQGDVENAIALTQMLVIEYINLGAKGKAADVIKRVKEDFVNSPAFAIVNAFDQMAAKLDQPAKGEAMDLHFTDVEGKKVNLADMKGKVVLVDYWATWCGVCIEELPRVLKTYKEYHDKGFEVIGISLDDEPDQMLQFAHENKMPWPQYCDGKGWKSKMATRWGVSRLPTTFLVGKDGRVAASNLRGEAFTKKVEELMK